MFEQIRNTKIYLGPMTKNVVDGVIDYNNITGDSIGLIASRRQIDVIGGYVNNWTTKDFVDYVKSKNNNVLVCRDHGGMGQGRNYDDGIYSFLVDAESGMDIIHIDPWKKLDIEDGIKYTVNIIRILSGESNCLFEIGTEESIFSMTPSLLDYIIYSIEKQIPELFYRVAYAVIQSGTSLKSGINTGNYDKDRLVLMTSVCSKYGLLSKEHNGDYLDPAQVKEKLSLGLSAINIAPEMANIETNIILSRMTQQQKDFWFDLCMEDGLWAKWFPKDFDPLQNKEEVLRLCGHYVLSSSTFINMFNLSSVSKEVKNKVFDFISLRRN